MSLGFHKICIEIKETRERCFVDGCGAGLAYLPSPGTFIVEFDAGQRLLNEVLSSEQNVNKAVEKLVAIAGACQFEGWLINIECRVDLEKIPLLK